MFNGEDKEKNIRKNYINKKEKNLKKLYMNILNNSNDGTLKEELYDIFKDELDIINSNNLI